MKENELSTLAEAIKQLESTDLIDQFLTDLCTKSELKAMKERWRVCQLLDNSHNFSYRDIHLITGASLTTIGRVAGFLRDEPHGGYRNLLDKMRKKNEKNNDK